MASPCKGKEKLLLNDLGDWAEDRENEDDKDEESEAFDWRKPIFIEEGQDYVRAREKKYQRDDLIPSNDGVAAKLATEIEKKQLEILKRELALISCRHSVRAHSSDDEEDRVGEK